MRRRKPRGAVAPLVILWIISAASARATDLHTSTAMAFDQYVQLTEARLDEEMRGKGRFLWIDRLMEPERQEAYVWLRGGEMVVGRMETRDAGRRIVVPGGLCHHWVGTIFAPDVTLDQTATLMQAYDTYPEIYRPAVRRAKILSRDGDRFTVSLQLFMKKVISVVLNTQNDVRYVRIAPTRMQVRSSSMRIAEVQEADTALEQEKPVGHDSGFLWRFNNYCALEERDGGTYIQCESVSLSRNIPTGLGWLVAPLVTSIPRESLEFTLQTLRGALMTRHKG